MHQLHCIPRISCSTSFAPAALIYLHQLQHIICTSCVTSLASAAAHHLHQLHYSPRTSCIDSFAPAAAHHLHQLRYIPRISYSISFTLAALYPSHQLQHIICTSCIISIASAALLHLHQLLISLAPAALRYLLQLYYSTIIGFGNNVLHRVNPLLASAALALVPALFICTSSINLFHIDPLPAISYCVHHPEVNCADEIFYQTRISSHFISFRLLEAAVRYRNVRNLRYPLRTGPYFHEIGRL